MTKASTFQKRRQALRKKLRDRGVEEWRIDQIIAERKAEHDQRLADQRAFEASQLGDKGYRPTSVDSVLTGQARATGVAAMAVRRRKTLTKYEYDQQESA